MKNFSFAFNGVGRAFTKCLSATMLVILLCTALLAQPAITSVSPNSGHVGDVIMITGSNFNTTPANNVVLFGATRATVSAATATTMTVTVPVGATYSQVTELDVTTHLMGYSPLAFTPTYDNNAYVPGVNFDPKIDKTTGAKPFGIAVGDIDGDGRADVAVANETSNTVSVYRNTSSSGAVSYATRVDFVVGLAPKALAIGDLDGDGKPDLAVANPGNDVVSVLRNTSSTGTIAFATNVDFTVGFLPTGIAIGDLDGDGKTDIVVTNNGDNTISVLRNTSSVGTINYATNVDFVTGAAPIGVAISDVDGDGKADIAVANNDFSDHSVSVLRNTSTTGAVSFAAKVDFTTDLFPWGLAIGDIDGDGKADVAVANPNQGTVSVLRNTSSVGTISYAAYVGFAGGNDPIGIAIGDLDGDGKAELAVAAKDNNSVSVLRNTSSTGAMSFAAEVDFAIGTTPYCVAIGDIDGDGRPDIVGSNSDDNTFSTLRNHPLLLPPPAITSVNPNSGHVGDVITITGTNFNTTAANNVVLFGATRATVTAATATSMTVTVPVGATYSQVTELDAVTGLIAYSPSAFTPTYDNTGNAVGVNFAPEVDKATGSQPGGVVITDVDKDGKADVVLINRGGTAKISVYRNTSTSGTVSYAPKVDFVTGGVPGDIVAADIDGDGATDIVVGRAPNIVDIFRNTSVSGTISFAARVDVTAGTSPYYLAVSDFDGDGKVDIVASDGDASMYLLRNIGSVGTIGFATFTNVAFANSFSDMVTGDLDGDGMPDIAVSASGIDSVSVYRNTSSLGSIGFATPVSFSVGNNPGPMAIADLDGDGKADVVTANYYENIVSILRNTGSSGTVSFAPSVAFATGSDLASLSVGDINGDGMADIVLGYYTPDSFSVLRNIGSSGTIDFAAKADFPTPGVFYNIEITVGDIDGDGKPDIVSTDYSNNTFATIRNHPLLIPPPTITSVAPNSGHVGDVITITGTNFNTTAANNVVLFGATRATVSAATATSMTVTVPAGATYSQVTELNISTALMAYSPSAFTPTFDNTGFGVGVNFDPKIDNTTGALPNSVAIGDVDGDGKADVVVSNYNDATISVFRNTSSSGAVSYAPEVDITTALAPTSIVISDLDGDGKVDIAVSSISNVVSVHRNTCTSGVISFAAYTDFPTGGVNSGSMAAGDIDGDGKVDLAIANQTSNTATVLRNTSNSGTISFATAVSFATNPTPQSICIGDMDGDGKPDIATANFGSNFATTLHNTSSSGTINFDAGVGFEVGPPGVQPYGIAIGDIDGDGKPDLAVATSSISVGVLRNTGNSGAISFAAEQMFVTNGGTIAIAIADMNGDGKADIAVTNGNNASVLRNTGSTGNLAFAGAANFATGAFPASIAVGDIDGDGRPDVVTANHDANTFSTIRNNPPLQPPTITSVSPNSGHVGDVITITGTNFSTTAANNVVLFGATRATVSAATATSMTVTVPAGATYSRVTELNTSRALTAYSPSAFTPTYDHAGQSSRPNFELPGVSETAGSNPLGLAVGDLDGDGKPDVIAGIISSNILWIYLNTSTVGAVSYAAATNVTAASGPGSVTLGDVDGDGKTDIVVACQASNTLAVFRNTSTPGAASFDAPVFIATGNSPEMAALVDIDRDGKMDIAVANAGVGTLGIFKNTSTPGTVQFANAVNFGTGISPFSLAIGDLDGDGIADIAVANLSSNTISVFRNTGNMNSLDLNSLAAPVDIATGSAPATVVIADLDGDGKPDMAVTNNNDYTISLLRNTGSSGNISFATNVDIPTGLEPYGLTIGDIDGDGKPDLAAGYYADNIISAYHNTSTTGNIGFAIRADFDFANPYNLLLADMDGDGKPDIVADDYFNNLVSTLRNDPGYVRTWAGTTSIDWNTAANWMPNGVPGYADEVTIPSGTPNSPNLNGGSFEVHDLSVATNVVVTTGTGDLGVKGALANNGSFAGTGAIVLSGTALQHITGTGAMENLTLNNINGAAIDAGNQAIHGTVTLLNGDLNANGHLTLLSDATATARIAEITGNGSLSGNITVQRYIPAKPARRFSFLASPVTNRIDTSWQKQIHVSGAGDGTGTLCTAADGTQDDNIKQNNGFDRTITHLSSWYYYDGTNNEWDSLSATNQGTATSGTMVPGRGYRVNVRGDRSVLGCTALIDILTATDAVTLSATGAAATGDVDITVPVAAYDAVTDDNNYTYELVGNPYPCEIDFDNGTWAGVRSDNNLTEAYYTYSPHNPSGTYTSYVDGVATNNTFAAADILSPVNVIASGQSFFVERYSVPGDVAGILPISSFFQENYKTNVHQLGTFKTTNVNDKIRVALNDSTGGHIDEFFTRFISNGTETYSRQIDASSFGENADYIATSKDDGRYLAISSMPDLDVADTLPVIVYTSGAGAYKLGFSEHQNMTSNVYLVDKYLGTTQDIKANPSYAFNVSSDANSFGEDRFYIVFNYSPAGVSNTPAPINTMHVYPNPVTEELNIDIANGDYNVRVLNATGIEVYNKDEAVKNNKITISTATLAAGIYMLETTGSNGKAVAKFVKS